MFSRCRHCRCPHRYAFIGSTVLFAILSLSRAYRKAGLIYATIRINFLNVGHAFMLLGHGREQRFYELERLWDPQKQRPDPDPAFSRFYVDASIAWAFLALVYLVCLLNVFSKL
jgi:hypothetical protein